MRIREHDGVRIVLRYRLRTGLQVLLEVNERVSGGDLAERPLYAKTHSRKTLVVLLLLGVRCAPLYLREMCDSSG